MVRLHFLDRDGDDVSHVNPIQGLFKGKGVWQSGSPWWHPLPSTLSPRTFVLLCPSPIRSLSIIIVQSISSTPALFLRQATALLNQEGSSLSFALLFGRTNILLSSDSHKFKSSWTNLGIFCLPLLPTQSTSTALVSLILSYNMYQLLDYSWTNSVK